MTPTFISRPSGYIPILMSGTVVAAIALHLSRFGLAHQTDEGTAAHLFQILMPLQLPLIGYFSVRWLPRDTSWAVQVLVVQVALFAAIVASVFFFLDR